ncbi:MAG: hypothetical protein JWP71_2571 [Mucilaginibacter sp.]|nr:hypothetical protein [Mucilaginibacter sp.]
MIFLKKTLKKISVKSIEIFSVYKSSKNGKLIRLNPDDFFMNPYQNRFYDRFINTVKSLSKNKDDCIEVLET